MIGQEGSIKIVRMKDTGFYDCVVCHEVVGLHEVVECSLGCKKQCAACWYRRRQRQYPGPRREREPCGMEGCEGTVAWRQKGGAYDLLVEQLVELERRAKRLGAYEACGECKLRLFVRTSGGCCGTGVPQGKTMCLLCAYPYGYLGHLMARTQDPLFFGYMEVQAQLQFCYEQGRCRGDASLLLAVSELPLTVAVRRLSGRASSFLE